MSAKRQQRKYYLKKYEKYSKIQQEYLHSILMLDDVDSSSSSSDSDEVETYNYSKRYKYDRTAKHICLDGIDEKIEIGQKLLVCSVCLENKVKTVNSCMHSCLCFSCARKIMGDTKKCPLCRDAPIQVQAVYFS